MTEFNGKTYGTLSGVVKAINTKMQTLENLIDVVNKKNDIDSEKVKKQKKENRKMFREQFNYLIDDFVTGNNNIYSYLENYGFGKLTGIDLQGEADAFLKPKNSWYPIDYSTVTFGQGIAVTPIQMITAFSSLINGGNLLKPYVVSKIISETKQNVIKPKIERQVISKETSDLVKQMLVSTIDHAEAIWDKPKGIKIGGKTGTAQIAIAGHYDPSMTNASFIGFFPADKPKFITLVILEEPKSSIWGSETAAPLFFEIAKELIVYYNIVPSQ